MFHVNHNSVTDYYFIILLMTAAIYFLKILFVGLIE